MEKHTYKQIQLSKLLLDQENPRQDPLPDQNEVVRTLLHRNASKLLKLARDIVGEGTNPADLPIVVPHPVQSDCYTVVEGNRRVAAMRILKDPSLASLAPNPQLRRRFEDLSKEASHTPLDTLQCVVFETKTDANHWIELRHTGENQGVGIVPWDAGAVARFKKGQSWMALQVADFVAAKASFDPATRDKVARIPITNLARLVNDPDVRDALGIRAEKGSIKAVIPEANIVKGLTRVVTDVATGAITVNDIRTKGQRQDYVERLVNAGALPPTNLGPSAPWELPAVPSRLAPRRGRPPITTRKSLIPSRCALRIPQHRLAKVFRELKLLDADQFTNCAAVMLRVFLELSLEEYVSTKRVPVSGKKTLAQKLRAVADHLEKNGVLDGMALKPVRVAASSRDALFSADTLHAYVHNKDFAPRPTDLKTTWDNMQPFMEAIWR